MADFEVSDGDVYLAEATTACRSCGAVPGERCRFHGSGVPLPEGVHWVRWTAYAARTKKQAA